MPDTVTISTKLLIYLREYLGSPNLEYAEPLTQLKGGFETASYSFQLSGGPKEMSGPLVLRLYPAFYGSGNAAWESVVQTVLAGMGYPVARAHWVCTDLDVLGGAFFIMDHLPGRLMVTEPMDQVPGMLGKVHAELHKIPPEPLVEAMVAAGFDEDALSISGRQGWLASKAEEFPWVREAADWLLENQPLDPEHLVVCHGDFHPLNVLVQDGRVSGVLDWPGFAIADPALDVAVTLILTTIPFKYVGPQMGLEISEMDVADFEKYYLAAYRAELPLDESRLDYYKARRCVQALIQGVEGQEIWRHPLIVTDLVAEIRDVTGITIVME